MFRLKRRQRRQQPPGRALWLRSYQDISCNGTYTVENIQGNVIEVAELIPTDFSGTAYATKEIFIGDIESIEDNTIILTDIPRVTDLNNLVSATIIVYNNGIEVGTNIVTAVTNRTLTVENTMESIGAVLAVIYLRINKKRSDKKLRFLNFMLRSLIRTSKIIS